MITRIARWEVEHDPALTAECYARYTVQAPCQCTDCRNFRALGMMAFTSPFQDLATQLGIDLAKPSELCHYGQPGAPSLTHGWFHLVGSLRSGRDAWRQVDESTWHGDLEAALGLKRMGLTTKIELPPKPFKGHPVVQLEFEAVVPWVLEA